MKRFNLIGAVLVALVAFAALTASSASALPELLPHGSWTGKNDGAGIPKLQSPLAGPIECKKAKGSGKDTSDTLGEFSITFEECALSGKPCKTAGDAAKTILASGTYHYVYDILTTLGVAILFLPIQTVIECEGFPNITVRGSANGGPICLVLEPTSSKVTHLFHCEQSKGVQSEKTFWNDSGEEKKANLECSFGLGFEQCSEEALAEVTYEAAQAFESV